MTKIYKLLYIFFLSFIWSVVVVLSIELGTRLFFYVFHFFYQPYFNMQNRKVYNMIPLEEQNKIFRRNVSKLRKGEGGDVNRQTNLNMNSDVICSKDYELTLQGIMEARFDSRGKLLEWYGEPLIGWYIRDLIDGRPFGYYHPDWQKVVEYVKNPVEQIVTMQLDYIEIYKHKYEVEIIPEVNSTKLIAKEIKQNFPHSLNHPSTPITEETPWLVYWLMYKPNFQGHPPSIPTNNFGFRDEDVILPKPPNFLRIVCIGGSTTEEGNDLYSTYPNLLEQKLREFFNTDKIDVVNCGICAIRSWGERIRIEDYLKLQPDLIIYYNAINDICYPHIAYWVSRSYFWKRVFTLSKFLNRVLNYKILPSEKEIAEHFRVTTLRNLGAMNCVCKKRGVKMAVCSFAYPKLKWFDIIGKFYCDFNMRNAWLSMLDIDITYETYLYVLGIYNRELKKFCEEEGMFYIPVAEEMNCGLDHFSDVCHTTRLGIELKSTIIADHVIHWIEEQGIFENFQLR